MRFWSLILVVSAAAGLAASGPAKPEAAADWERDGRSLFLACEFKQSARVFENALAQHPDNARLHYWLGKSYARLAEVSGLLSASKNARKAQYHLELAVRIDPRNDEYVRELFDFYLNSPEWFGGGLTRAAALLERIDPDDPGADAPRQQLADSRKEHSGAGWWMQWAVLRTSGTMGYLIPRD